MNKNTILLLLVFFFHITSVSAGSCDAYDLMLDCKKKNESGIVKSANDYLCINSQNNEEILFNIILDEQFASIDAKAYDYLSWLEVSKNYFFGASARSSYIQGVDIIGLKFGKKGEYWQEYKKVCNTAPLLEGELPTNVVQLTTECLRSVDPLYGQTSIGNAHKFFMSSTCMDLAETKLDIYKIVAYDLLKINKAAIRRDNRKRFMQNQRTKYEMLMGLMRENVGYLERIWKKWPSKTKNTYNG